MRKRFRVIIGITIFIIILCGTYIKFFLFMGKDGYKRNEDNTTEEETTQVEQGNIVYKGKLPMPVENFIQVTSKFGKREAHGVVHSNHTGIDLCGSLGSKVMSVADGEVTWAGWQGGYGNCVEIKHTDENGKTFYSFYGHMRDRSLQVEKGQQVTLGQVIGTQGSTGNSTGDHLHFEIRTNSGSNQYAIDPAPYLFTEKEGSNG
ncbi:MAG: M23 family metallopeptidase [Clostridia bacterium]|nr:M23 family metallopeptidase [Clostridia bacterium]